MEKSLSKTQELVEYVASLDYDQIPPEVVMQVKNVFLDCLGCGLAGSQTEPMKAIDKMIKENSGSAPFGLMGIQEGSNPPLSAFRNAAVCNILDYDDTFLRLGHYSSTIVHCPI